jgi:multicomponent Na+:H+ antiporter subunit G
MSAREVVATVLLGMGVGIELIACLGVLVMRDLYDRLHYNGPAIVGALAIGAAVVVRESFSLIGNKALLLGLFVLATSPLLSHATARAARLRQRGDWRLGPDEDVEVEE